MTLQIDKVTLLLEETAAEEILPRFRSLKESDVRVKSRGDLVTIADEAAEARISQALRELLPGSRVVGEEAVAADPSVLQHLEQHDPIWLVDPLDGTGNFTRGEARFAVMVALVQDGKPRAAWIHEPIAGRTTVAEAGSGAWVSGQRLHVADAAPLAEMTGTLHAGVYAPPQIARKVDSARKCLCTIKSLRCAGAEYLRLASGQMHFSLFTKMSPWDHTPGTLIHTEAGGSALMLNQQPYDPVNPDIGVLMAPDRPSWQAIYEVLFGP